VATELKSFQMEIDADVRLAAAAGGVVCYLADLAGLENDPIARLQSAVIAACSEAFKRLTPDRPQLKITFTRFSDRIEVAVSPRGQDSSSPGFDTIAALAEQAGGARSNQVIFAGFDLVRYETRGSEAVTRLTKYIGQIVPNI
jgi:hypothetical protein